MTDADFDDEAAPEPDEAGYYLPVDMEYYQSISSDVRAILNSHADTFEPVSIDEAYLPVTDRTTWDDVEAFAQDQK